MEIGNCILIVKIFARYYTVEIICFALSCPVNYFVYLSHFPMASLYCNYHARNDLPVYLD